LRCNLLQHFHPLPDHGRLVNHDASYIAAWTRETCDEAGTDRIDNEVALGLAIPAGLLVAADEVIE